MEALQLNACSSIKQWTHTLEDGGKLKIISSEVAIPKEKPPLVFIHGAGHGAWCWQENFIPYLTKRGYSCYAIGLRIQAGKEPLKGFSDDISHFIAQHLTRRAPILVGHSFGGLISQAYVLRGYESRAKIAGLGLLVSAPPMGMDSMSYRIMWSTPFTLLRLMWAFITKSYMRSASELRFLWFSADLADEKMNRYAQLFWEEREPAIGFDPSVFKAELPLPPPSNPTVPVFVLGAEKDRTVDQQAFRETAEWYKVQPVIVPKLAHDVMLDTRWQDAAEALEKWFAEL